MICKWCGAGVDPSQRKCAACGRELPPMSECGGFYNIVKNSDLPRRDNGPITQVLLRRDESAPAVRKKNSPLPWLALGLAILALLLTLLFRVADNTGDEIENLRADLERAGERIDELEDEISERDEPQIDLPENPSTEAVPPETEAPVDEKNPLIDDDIVLSVEGDSAPDFSALEALGYPASPENNGAYGYTYVFKNEDSELLTLSFYEDTDAPGEYLVGYSIGEGDPFGARNTKDSDFEFSVGGDDLTGAFADEESSKDGISWRLTPDAETLQAYADEDGYVELVCKLTRVNTEGSVLTLNLTLRVNISDLPEPTEPEEAESTNAADTRF